jgi:hypothetical protein
VRYNALACLPSSFKVRPAGSTTNERTQTMARSKRSTAPSDSAPEMTSEQEQALADRAIAEHKALEDGRPLPQVTPERQPGAEPATEGEQREKIPHANVITDPVAGMKFHFNYETHKAAITFDDGKPSDKIREALTGRRFTWNPKMVAWERQIHFETRAQEREDAKRAFFEIADMMRAEKGSQPAIGIG